ncbi:MAG: methyltransferase domain-containing protein [Candidatus Dormiibacterota bacterium]
MDERPHHRDDPLGMSPRGLHRLLHRVWFPLVHGALAREASPRPGETVLDVGCGTGELARRLARSGAHVVGVDPDERSIATAGAGGESPAIEFHCVAVEGLPLRDGSVDAVVSSVSAHHWEDREKGFAELARVLRPGGRMVLAELRPAPGVRRALDRGTAHRDLPDASEWLRLLAEAGFDNVRVVDVGWRGRLALFMRAERRH